MYRSVLSAWLVGFENMHLHSKSDDRETLRSCDLNEGRQSYTRNGIYTLYDPDYM